MRTKTREEEYTGNRKKIAMSGYFEAVDKALEGKGLKPEHLDYALGCSSLDDRLLETDDFTIESQLDYGGSEGIYLDLYIRENSGDYEGKRFSFATYKTLRDDDVAMRDMGALLGSFIAEASAFRRKNLEDFRWSGYIVSPILPKDGIAAWGYCCDDEEILHRNIGRLYKELPEAIGVEIFSHENKKSRFEAREGHTEAEIEKLLKGDANG